MLQNENASLAFNDFTEMSYLPYKIVEALLMDNSKEANEFFKILKYSDANCLEKDDLSFDEKVQLVWNDDALENNYSIFLKPLIGSSLDTADAQTQMRLYRYNTMPTNRMQAIVCFEADLITNEKSSLIKKDGMLIERTDYMEALYLSLLNGRDIGIGNGYLAYDRELSRSCNSQLTIGNSKNFYGRSVVLALMYANGKVGDICG